MSSVIVTGDNDVDIIAEHTVVLPSDPSCAPTLMSALEACARHDLYWSNEFFYRWMSSNVPQKKWYQRVFPGRRPDDVPIEVDGCRVVVQMERGIASDVNLISTLAADGRFPGAAVAWARWLAKGGRLQEALTVAKDALASIEGSRIHWEFHVLRNQITAIERRMAGKRVHRGLDRYLGDDDGYLLARTCSIPFERIDLQENGNAAVCCAQWMPGFSVGNVITGNETASQIFNNERTIEGRRSVLDGSFRFCDLDKCPYLSGERLPTKAWSPKPIARRLSRRASLPSRPPPSFSWHSTSHAT